METNPPDRRELLAVPAALALLALLLLQGLLFIGEASQTSDEAVHIAAGYSYLRFGDFRLNPEHPPLIKELAALPLLLLDLRFPRDRLLDQPDQLEIGRTFVHGNRVPNDTILRAGRLPILILSLGLGWVLFRWSRDLFGARGALLSLSLFALDPNVVAHSSLVTTDLGVTLFTFLSIRALWRWSRAPSPGRLASAGLWTGAAFASKFTALWIVPMLGVLAFVLLDSGAPLPDRPWSSRSPLSTGTGAAGRRVAGIAMAGMLLAAIACLVVSASYAGHGLPAFMEGLRIGLGHAETGHPAYLMGSRSTHGWWYYFLVAYLLKTPIGTLVLLALALLAFALGSRRGFIDESFVWIPIAATVAITCLVSVDIGLRHFLPAYPFLYLSAGRIGATPETLGTGGRPWHRRTFPGAARAVALLVAACLAWDLREAAFIAPYDLAYFNQIAGGPARGHLYLVDSNLDWGQASKALRRYQESAQLPVIYCAYSGNSDPWYYGVRYQYVPGAWNLESDIDRPDRVPEGMKRELLAVGATVLHDVHSPQRPLFAWLLRRDPVATPGYSYLVYDITGSAESHARLAFVYLEAELFDGAEREARRALRLDPSQPLALRVLQQARAAAAGGTSPPR